MPFREPIHTNLIQILERIKNEMQQAGVETSYYMLDDYKGYTAVTGNKSDTVYCIECHLTGNTYAIAQIFWEDFPNLILVSLVALEDSGEPVKNEATFTKNVDAKFSQIFLPLMYRAFNTLDPKDQLRSVVIQRYTHVRLLLEDFFPAIFYTFKLMVGASLTGQLATIAGGSNDILIRIIARMFKPFSKWANIHLISEQKQTSAISIAVQNRTNPMAAPFEITSSTALDECLLIAKQYVSNR